MAINLADNNPRISYTVVKVHPNIFAVPLSSLQHQIMYKDGVLQTITTTIL